jgi:hypothetical protein
VELRVDDAGNLSASTPRVNLRGGDGHVDTPYPFLESSDEIKRRLEERFPGVIFTLPPIPAGYPDPNQTYAPHW